MATTERDYYELLGVPRTADDREIKRAFRQKARELHPDVSDAPDAESQFREVVEAYEVLSKPETRDLYDRFGCPGGHIQAAFRCVTRFGLPNQKEADAFNSRVHGCWISDDEVKAVCEFLRTQGTAVYEEVALPTSDGGGGDSGDGAERDHLYWDCVRLVIGQRAGSISFLQRRMGLGYPKAARFIDMMEQDRIIGPGQGAKPREILVGPEYLEKSGRA